MSMSMLDLDDDVESGLDFLDDIKAEATVQAESGARRELQVGAMRTFYMPPPEADKKRRATIRFLMMLNEGVWVLEHSNWDEGWNSVCPAHFGFECEWCAKICEVSNVTRKQFLHDAENLAKYASKKKMGFKSEKIRMWPVWYYEANDNKGDVYLFAYPVNGNSPIPTIVERDEQFYFHPDEGYEPVPITEYKLKLVQTNEGKDRMFDAQTRGTPVPFEHQEEVDKYMLEHPFDRANLRFAYAINKAGWLKDDAWLKKLQEARKQLLAETKAAQRVAEVKAAPKRSDATQAPVSRQKVEHLDKGETTVLPDDANLNNLDERIAASLGKQEANKRERNAEPEASNYDEIDLTLPDDSELTLS